MDRRLRELERRWKGSGDIHSHAALLGHLYRCGDIDDHRLSLAAHLGHEAARRVYSGTVPNGLVRDDVLIKNIEMQDWAYNIVYWGKKPVICLAAAAIACIFCSKKLSVSNEMSMERAHIWMLNYIKGEYDYSQRLGILRDLADYQPPFSLDRQQHVLMSCAYGILYDAHKAENNSIGKDFKLKLFAQTASHAHVYFDDEVFKSQVRMLIYPLTLGKYA